MTERLTRRNSDGAYFNGINGKCSSDKYGRFYGEAAEKLAHYEDLEEQGRLVVLPEELDRETFFKHLALTACPSFVGLKDWQGTENCKDTTERCKECWETALKGGAEK